MHAFNYHVAASLDDASARVASDDKAKFLAGGMSLIPTMKQRLAAPSELVDLSALHELSGICRDGDRLIIGAMTTHSAVAGSAVVRDLMPGLAELAEGIGHPQIRHRGTLGGAIANNDPAADYTAAVLALGATIRTNRREIAADAFFTAKFRTALQPDEIIVAVAFPITVAAAYRKFPTPASRYAMAGVFVARFGGEVRVAVTGAASLVYREPLMERALEARFDPAAVEHLDLDVSGFIEDIHGSAGYREQLVRVMAARTVAAVVSRTP